ncbi:MAG: hypothetical protein RR515_01155 [Clostridium sp.]
MGNSTKIIDLNQRRKFKKYRKWFELYAKFLAIFKKKPKNKGSRQIIKKASR